MEAHDPPTGQWQEGPGPVGEPYRPNEAFARALAAKRRLDRRLWGGGGGVG